MNKKAIVLCVFVTVTSSFSQAQESSAPLNWNQAQAPDKGNVAFPAPPEAQSKTIGQSNFSAAHYSVNAVQPPSSSVPQNGVAPLPPLQPPEDQQRQEDLRRAETMVAPYQYEEIVNLRKQLEETRRATSYKPVRSIPRVSSISVDLSPGASLPIARGLPGEMVTLNFIDSTGASWPLAAEPRVSNPQLFFVEWLESTSTVIISPLSAYGEGNLTVLLQGLSTPVVIKLSSGEPDTSNESRIVDYRLDLRIPGRGPFATAPMLSDDKIALYDDVLQAFLDGIPPSRAEKIAMQGEVPARTKVWQYDGSLYIRTQCDIRTAFDTSLSAGDGTRVYRVSPTPYITLSNAGRSVVLQLDINN